MVAIVASQFEGCQNLFIPKCFIGVEGGLRLVLNVEQYEYMQGPNAAAGVKIALHGESQHFPTLKDQGFAVPPGADALVALKVVEVPQLNPKCSSIYETRFICR
jgi:hypothetical protein